MTRKEVVTLMRSSNTDEEWNDNVDTIKKHFNGYPDFWYEVIIVGGVSAEFAARTGVSDQIQLR